MVVFRLLNQKYFRADLNRVPRCLVVLMVYTQMCTPVQVDMASAASFKIIPDGKVQVKAFGETLVFRSEDSGRILFGGLPASCPASAGGSTKLLITIMNNAVIRDCIEKTTGIDVGKYPGAFSIQPQRQGDVIYPGPVTVKSFPVSAFDYNAIRISFAERDGAYRCKGPLPQVTSDELGFVSQSIGPAYQKAKQYRLPASLRTGGASRPLCVSCVPILGNEKDQVCSLRLETPNRQVSMTLSWTILQFDGPDPSWITYDKTARTIANSIFVERPSGDLQ